MSETNLEETKKALETLAKGSSEQKLKTLYTIRDFGLNETLEAVATLLVSSDEVERVKVEALRTLSVFGFPTLDDLLITLFNNESSPEVRRNMALNMGYSGNPVFFDYLVRLLKSESEDYNVRYVSASSLGKLGDKKAIPILLDLLPSIKNSVIKSGLIMCLEKLGASEAIDLIVQELLAGDEIIRLAAIEALAALGDEKVIPPLQIVAEQDETETWRGKVCDVAAEAIVKIREKAVG